MDRLRLLLAITVLALGACKGNDKGNGSEAAAATVKDDKSAKAAEDLLAKRDALMKSRQTLQEQREALEAEKEKILAENPAGDTSEIDKKIEESRSQEADLTSQESALSDEMQAFLETAKNVSASGDAQQMVAARESGVASREKAIAAREERIAQRERDMAAREKALADREREMCSGGGGGTTIIQMEDPKGTKYGKRDVESALKKARAVMSKKGILSSDLPAQAAGLEKESTKAMADGDYGPARFAAQQLYATVDAMKIDRAFISGKIGRLSKRMKGATLEAGKQKEVDELFAEATSKYGDGDYAGANKKLNAIYRAID